jgi:hypothetical protein
MFDPRMMAPDGSSYSRANALAPLAATSGMTPPGVQTLGTPVPGAQPNALGNWGGPGGFAAWRQNLQPGQLGQMLQDWRGAMQDWRGLRPSHMGQADAQAPDWRAQYTDWRNQRPDRREFFQNYQFPGV